MCAWDGILVWPEVGTIAAEQTFMIEGFADSQKTIRKLGRGYRAVLSDGTTTIELVVIGRYEGAMFLTEVLVKPSIPLTVGKTYELSFIGLPKEEAQPNHWNSGTQTWEPMRWNVTDMPQPLAGPLSQPRETGKTLMHYGCGPEMHVHFRIAPEGSTNGLVQVAVSEKGGGRRTTYVLRMQDGRVEIGHGMCSGAFTFETGETYTVTFDPIGPDGKPTGRATVPVTFTPPVKETRR